MQEHIRKKQQKQDYEKSVKEQMLHKHAQRRRKIIVVANRLPMDFKRHADGSWTFEKSPGGLVSCFAGIQARAKFDMVWIGWPGGDIPEEDREMVTAEAMKQNCFPVFLTQELISDYYNGFANNVLWPLLHYIMPPCDKGVNECNTSQWEAYKRANELFVEAIIQVYEDDDYVWVHDYHLMVVPKILRDQKPDANIGWFLHTPFPSAEIYRTLPWRQEIIEGLLHANLLGFHVYDYLRHFLSSCVQLTSLEISAHKVDATCIGGCMVTCATVPIGIAPSDFTDALETPEVKAKIEALEEQYAGRRVILGIDRLDYMKGIPHKLRAFGCFLDLHPDWADRCVLVQLAVPSRRAVPEYQRLQRQVHEIVGQITGRHSKLETGSPVIYLDSSMSFFDLVALYHVADVALITSLRDGMNLVAYEFIAGHKGKEPPGVLILSEFAGAAQSLGAGSIRVNPWNLQETANAIHEALEMAPEDRAALHSYAYSYVVAHNSQRWAETFLQCLEEACSDSMEITTEVPPLLPYEDLLTEWQDSSHRLIIIDLLECLVPPKRARPGMKERRKQLATLPEDLRQCLHTIASCPNTTVVLTTDKSRDALEQMAGGLPVILAPEGCSVYRVPGSDEWRRTLEDSEVAGLEEWMDGVKTVFDYFRERTPGSTIEEQEFQRRWAWENAQLDFGSAQAREVLIHLWAGPLVNSEADVVVADRSITVRPHSCSRAACLERLLRAELGEEEIIKHDFALIFAVVSHRDEDVFECFQNLLEACAPTETPELRSRSESAAVSDESPMGESEVGWGLLPHQLAPDTEDEDSCLHTPPIVVPPVLPGEEPPDYDWIPTAQREWEARRAAAARGDTDNAEKSSTDRRPSEEQTVVFSPLPPTVMAMPTNNLSTAGSDYRPSCPCYTLSLGMKKTRAQHALPHAYHVQNLIRAMAARLNS